MAEGISFEYRESDDVVLVTAGSAVSGSELRNPLMASCNLLREKSGASYILDFTCEMSLDADDKEWVIQHFIPLVKRSCAGRIVLILPFNDERRDKIDEAFSELIGYFFAEDYDGAIKVLHDIDLKEQEEAAPKIAGKTKKQWRDHFSYVWFKYSIFPITIAIIALLLLGIFGRTKNDVVIYSFGFFEVEDTYMSEALKNEGFKVPFFPAAVVVMPNQEGKNPTGYDQENASAYFMTNPDVIVSDGITYGYFYTSFGVYPESYQRIMDSLSAEAKKHIEPVYMSAKDAEECVRKYNAWSGKGDPDIENSETASDDTTKVIIGLRLNDTEACRKLGYKTGWEKSDSRLIFSMYAKCTDREKAEKAMTVLLNSAY